MFTFLEHAHMSLTSMFDVTEQVGLGWGGVNFFQIERKITSVVHSHPPSHYIRTHAFCPQHDY